MEIKDYALFWCVFNISHSIGAYLFRLNLRFSKLFQAMQAKQKENGHSYRHHNDEMQKSVIAMRVCH